MKKQRRLNVKRVKMEIIISRESSENTKTKRNVEDEEVCFYVYDYVNSMYGCRS